MNSDSRAISLLAAASIFYTVSTGENPSGNWQSSTEQTVGKATEQYASGGIAMVIDNDVLLGSATAENKSESEIAELREILAPEGKLFREIMKNYEKNTRPVFKASHIVNINLTFTFSQVLNVEEKEQSMSVILWMDHFWFDEKLIWNPDHFDGISDIKIPSGSIWLPDIVLYNTAEERIKKTTDTGSRAYLKYTGEVYWPPVKRYMSSCNIDITYFPFDDQICFLKLGSWAYDGFQVNIWNTMSTMDMSHALKNSEFEVVDSRIRRYITYYDCCIEPYPDIKVYIHIRRQTIQHVFNIVIPCITLSIICMVGFLIPPDKNDEKISVQLTVLFSLSLFMLLVAESTPRTSESVPLISIYLTALMCITAMSTTAHVVCDKLVASPSVRTEVPYLANKLIYQLTKCCQKRKTEVQNPEVVVNKDLTRNEQPADDKEVVDKTTSNGLSSQLFNKIKPHPVGRGRRGHSLPVIQEGSTLQMPSTEPTAAPRNEKTEEGLQGLFQHLKVRQDKIRTDLQDTAKWYKVATKMDRIFFWSYGISVTILTCYAFVFKPMQKHVEL